MTLIIYSITTLANYVFAFKKKYSKTIVMLTFFSILLLAGGAGPNYVGQNDFINYKIRYEGISNVSIFSNSQVGYTLLMKMGKLLNLDFFTFRVVIIGLCLILIYKYVIKRYSYNHNYIILLYLVYPMMIDSEHLRNFIAMTVLLIGIRFLDNRSLKSSIQFLIIVLISASFHTAFLVYSSLLMLYVKNRRLLIKIIASITIIITIITIINNNNIPFLNTFLTIIENEKIIGYFSTKTNLGYLMPVLLQVTSIILLFWSKKILLRKKSTTSGEFAIKGNLLNQDINKEINIADLILWINVIGIIFFPLFIMNLQFYRLIRNFLILNYTVYSLTSFRLKRKSLYRFLYNSSVVLSVILWFVFDLIIKTNPERIIIPFFTQNFFLN